MAHIVIIFCDDVARGKDFVYLAKFGGFNAAMVAFQKVFRPWALNLRGSGAGRYKYIDISPPHLKQREPEYSSNFVAWLPSGLFVVVFAMICFSYC